MPIVYTKETLEVLAKAMKGKSVYYEDANSGKRWAGTIKEAWIEGNELKYQFEIMGGEVVANGPSAGPKTPV